MSQVARVPGDHTPPPFRELVPLFDASDWVQYAKCRGTKADVWHPDKSVERSAAKVRDLRDFCWDCPVRLECLAMAVLAEGAEGVGSRYGVFGGLTGAERGRAYRAAYEDWMRPPRCARGEVGTLKGHLIHLKQGEISCHACCGAAKAERKSRV